MGSSCCKGSKKNKPASKIPPKESGSMDQNAADDAHTPETKAALGADVKIPNQPSSSTVEMTEMTKNSSKQDEMGKSARHPVVIPKIPPKESLPMVHQPSAISHETEMKTGSSSIKIPIELHPAPPEVNKSSKKSMKQGEIGISARDPVTSRPPPEEKKLEETASISVNEDPKEPAKPDQHSDGGPRTFAEVANWRARGCHLDFKSCRDPFYVSEEEYISAQRKSSITAVLTKLAVDLYPNLASSENIVFSPLTIALALALLEQGASGKTGEGIRKLLSPVNSEPTSSDKNLLTSIECGILYGELQETFLRIAKEDGQLCIGNTVFCDTESAAAIRKYEDNVKGWFKNDPINKAPFKNDTEKARQRINEWVLEKTMGTVSELYPSGGLSADSVIVSVNSIYAKTDGFYRKEGVFYPVDGKKKQKAKFVCGNVYWYLGKEDFHALELPYKGSTGMAMFVILPRRKDGIKELEKKVNVDFLVNVFASFRDMSRNDVSVYYEIPIFTMRFETSLVSALAKLGFQTRNDLERMFDRQQVNSRGKWTPEISDIKHVACIKMDEKRMPDEQVCGTTARGIWKIVECGYPEDFLLRPPPLHTNFVADHPFMFVIVQKPTWSIMLMGKVNSIENK